MSIQITPNFQNYIKNNQNFTNKRNIYSPNYANNLVKDTVSFGSGKNKATEAATEVVRETFRDLIKTTYESQLPSHRAMGDKFMDTIAAIADKFKEYGISFDREYCGPATVKGTDSYLLKFLRSGAVPADPIRSTMFNDNPYNLKVLNDLILPEFEKRGYVIQVIPDKMAGRKVLTRKPDFDVRLADLDEKAISALDEHLRPCIGGPQKSGYEDIQMRFIDIYANKKNQVPHELLILFGKNYANAKHDESYYVYDITRALKDAMHISKIENPPLHSPEKRVKDNIKIIAETLNSSISKLLFFNGKNMDFHKDETQIPIEISKTTANVLTGLMEGIRNKTLLYYGAKVKQAKSMEYQSEIIRQIKLSSEYKEREDKTIYAADIEAKREEILNRIKAQKAEDLSIIRAARERLEETLEKFGEKTLPTEEVK